MICLNFCPQLRNLGLIRLVPDQPTLRIDKAFFVTFWETGDDTAVHSAIDALPAPLRDGRGALSLRLHLAVLDRNWRQLKELIEKMNGGHENGDFSYAAGAVPVSCYSILLARFQGEQPEQNPRLTEVREQLSHEMQNCPEQLGLVDALLGKKQDAIAQAKRASELCPASRDAWRGVGIAENLAVVYAWTGEIDLSFDTLRKLPYGPHYGDLKVSPYWDPLRKDPRFDKLLAELAPKE
jgi:hypothetical protein